MASYTGAELIDRALRYADQEGSSFIGTQERLDLLNEAVTEVRDRLVAAGENHFCSSTNLSLSSAAVAYALPADFYKVLSVDYQVATNTYIPLNMFSEADRRGITPSIPSCTVRLRYVPLSAEITSTATEVDGFHGWDKLIVLYMAEAMLLKEESDLSAIQSLIRRQERRIDEMAQNRNAAMGFQTVDKHQVGLHPTANDLRWKLYGSNIEFITAGLTGV